MRILIAGLNFHPELTGIGKYTAEMAVCLAGKHQVRIVTAPPYYPHWNVQAGYKWWQYRAEEWQGIEVFRAPLWVPRRPTGLKRLLHLLSYAISSFPVLLLQAFWRPDVVICIAPAFFSAPFAWLAARLCGAKAWLHLQDFELDAATSLGMLPSDGLMPKAAAWGERSVLQRFDRVSTISNGMMKRLEEKGLGKDKPRLFPNWIDTNDIFPLHDGKDSLREELEIPKDKTVVLYSGTMGMKQGIENLAAAAERLRENSNLHFVFCGEGAARGKLEDAARGLTNVQFACLQPPEKLNRLLNTADIHVLPQRAGAADLVMPSKLLGMFASGKAVIATAEPATEVGRVVGEAGLLVPPDDVDALCEAILKLGDSREERERLGAKGRRYACENWEAGAVLGRFEGQLRELAGAT